LTRLVTGRQRHREDLLRLDQPFQGKSLLIKKIGFAVVGRTEFGVLQPQKERQAASAMEALTASVCHSNSESTLFACNIRVQST
jgi:hypothetical protein